MTAAGSARASGYQGDNDSIRQAGSRAAKSTAVMQLLSLAAAEAGGGDDGVVGTEEARRILSRLARGSDPLVRIRALESLAKLEDARKAELAARQDEDVYDPDESARDMICAIPMAGTGAALALGFRFNGGFYRISTFPFLKEVAPIVSQKFPENWARWRARCDHPVLKEELAFIDECARGPLLEGEALMAAVRAKCPGNSKPRVDHSTDEPANATQ